MMTLFSDDKRSTDNAFHNNDMFKDVSFPVSPWVVWYKYFSIPLFNNKRLSAKQTHTFSRTKSGGDSASGYLSCKFNAAIVALLGDGSLFWARLASLTKHILAVMLSAISDTKVNSFAPFDRTISFWGNWFSLVNKTFPLLPFTITGGRAKVFIRNKLFPAVLAISHFVTSSIVNLYNGIYHKTKEDARITSDGNHFSIEYEGKA